MDTFSETAVHDWPKQVEFFPWVLIVDQLVNVTNCLQIGGD